MNNFIKPGDTVTLTAPVGGVVSGTPVLIGSLVAIPTNTVAAGLPFEGKVTGVCTVPKATGAAWTEGQTLYYDSTAGNFATAQSLTARRAGNAAAAAASGDTTGAVRLLNIAAPVNVA